MQKHTTVVKHELMPGALNCPTAKAQGVPVDYPDREDGVTRLLQNLSLQLEHEQYSLSIGAALGFQVSFLNQDTV